MSCLHLTRYHALTIRAFIDAHGLSFKENHPEHAAEFKSLSALAESLIVATTPDCFTLHLICNDKARVAGELCRVVKAFRTKHKLKGFSFVFGPEERTAFHKTATEFGDFQVSVSEIIRKACDEKSPLRVYVSMMGSAGIKTIH